MMAEEVTREVEDVFPFEQAKNLKLPLDGVEAKNFNEPTVEG